MTDSPVDRLRELLAAATATPWFHGDNDGWGHGRGWHVWAASPDVADGDEQFVAFTGRLTERWSPQDAALIAEGITALPALLDVARWAAEYVDMYDRGSAADRHNPLVLLRRALAALEAGAGQEQAG